MFLTLRGNAIEHIPINVQNENDTTILECFISLGSGDNALSPFCSVTTVFPSCLSILYKIAIFVY